MILISTKTEKFHQKNRRTIEGSYKKKEYQAKQYYKSSGNSLQYIILPERG